MVYFNVGTALNIIALAGSMCSKLVVHPFVSVADLMPLAILGVALQILSVFGFLAAVQIMKRIEILRSLQWKSE
nr:hypothetical protein HmN_000473600 [Hymenolepis microstoma]